MSNHQDSSGETPSVLLVCTLAAIVGVLIIVQIFRAQPMDTFSMLLIAVCFVVSVVATAMWSKRSGV